MKLLDLSHTLATGLPVYPGDETVPRIIRNSSHGPDSHQSSSLVTGCHAGTHIDLPLHFLDGEPALEDFPLEGCAGRAVVLDAGEGRIDAGILDGVDLGGVDFVVFRTGWERRFGGADYYRDWPWLDPALARRLAAADLKGVGLDTPSIDPFGGDTAHGVLAAAGMINIENMANLSAAPAGPFTLLVLPLKLRGAEASPVRAVALI